MPKPLLSMESFFATLKKELLYRISTYRMTMEQVKTRVFRYVFTYYNQMRVYTSNPSGLPPAVYRRMQMAQPGAPRRLLKPPGA